jgi:hypothetical protein
MKTWGSGGMAPPPLLTLVLDGGAWAASCPPLPVPIGYEARWSPEPGWTLWRREKYCPVGNPTWAVQPVARLYIDWAIPIPKGYIMSHVWVTIDGVWTDDSIYRPLIQSRLVSTLYRSLAHIDQCLQSITVSTSRFLATDFNTRIIIVSLNYTLQISHIKSSSHSRTFNWAILQLTRNHFTPTS